MSGPRSHMDARAGRRVLRIIGGVAALVLLAACAPPSDAVARRARTQLVGLAADDLRFCAGPPDRTVRGEGDAEFWSYERVASLGDLTLSTSLLGLNLARDGECRATFEIAGGRVRRLAYARAVGSTSARYAACVPLVRECHDLVGRGVILPLASPPPSTPVAEPPEPAAAGSG